MSAPRFLFIGTSGTRPANGAGLRHSPEDAVDVLWRLVGGNNHVLGRAPQPCADLSAAHAAVHALVARVAELEVWAAPHSRPGRWSWQVSLPGSRAAVLAVSARSYERARESRRSVELFLAAVPQAPVSPGLALRPRQREAHGMHLLVVPQSSRTGVADAGTPAG